MDLTSSSQRSTSSLNNQRTSSPHHSVPLSRTGPSPSIRTLSVAAQKAIGQNGAPGDIVLDMQGASITRANLQRLLNSQSSEDMMIDDEIINFWCARLMERANAPGSNLPKTYCFSTHLTKSSERFNWARRIKLFDMELVLFPIHVSALKHWTHSCSTSPIRTQLFITTPSDTQTINS